MSYLVTLPEVHTSLKMMIKMRNEKAHLIRKLLEIQMY